MIYQSEHVLRVFTYSEMVRFWSSVCFQSSATYHLFYLSILSFNSCLIEIQFLFSYNILENFSLFVWFFLCRVETSHLCHIRGSTFSSVFPWCVCMNALPFIFILLLLIGQLCVDLLIPPLNLFPNSLSSIQAGGEGADLSLLSTFLCWGSRRKVEGFKGFCSYSFAVLVDLLNVPETQVEENCRHLFLLPSMKPWGFPSADYFSFSCLPSIIANPYP